jgi:hypothetical protein
MHNYDAVIRRTVFRNVDQHDKCSRTIFSGDGINYQCGSSKVILKACSATVDFEAEPLPFYLTQLTGRYLALFL